MESEQLDLSVIIPFKNHSKLTIACIESFLKYGPEPKEFLLVSNNSTPDELGKVRSSLSSNELVKILEYNRPFNYQKLNNWAVGQAEGKFILFLNNDTELVKESRGLIERMYKKAAGPKVGITGCLLLYGDANVIQHAGVFLVPRGMADHLYVGKKIRKVEQEGGKTEDLPYSISEDRPLTAVTGAVSLVEKAKFLKVGGFNEKFIITGGDVDLCLRLNRVGYQTWYAAGGHILHKESQSRSFQPIPFNDFYQSYFSYIQGYDTKVGDPFLPKITEGLG